MIPERVKRFVAELKKALENDEFIKLILSSRRVSKSELKSVSAKIISTAKGVQLSLVYRNDTNDVTKNFNFEEAVEEVQKLLIYSFYQAELKTTTADWHLILNTGLDGKLKRKEASQKNVPTRTHDKQKKLWVKTKNNIYLRDLGVLTNEFKIKPSRQDKFRQINKYVEIMDGVIRSAKLSSSYTVADMGAGKGYLTFALYDHLRHSLKHDVSMVGVELRPNLIETCNAMAKSSGFDQLHFLEGTIQDAELEQLDVLIALHACDTATDDAIARGVKSKAKVIVVAPCCQKQIRKEMDPQNEMCDITQFGILKERQAELLTDGLRALIMEAHGYKTNVFEFISNAHTPKNVMIVGVKEKDPKTADAYLLQRIEAIKELYGIKKHYLETLLN